MSSGKLIQGVSWLGREHVQNARSARALGVHGTHSTKCQCMLEVTGEAGKKQG